MNIRVLFAAVVVIAAIAPQIGAVGLIDVTKGDRAESITSEDLSVDWGYSVYDHNGFIEAKVGVEITNHGNETVHIIPKITPVDKHGVTYRSHTLDKRSISPGETVQYNSVWDGDDQNQRGWDELDIKLKKCGPGFMHNCTVVQ